MIGIFDDYRGAGAVKAFIKWRPMKRKAPRWRRSATFLTGKFGKHEPRAVVEFVEELLRMLGRQKLGRHSIASAAGDRRQPEKPNSKQQTEVVHDPAEVVPASSWVPICRVRWGPGDGSAKSRTIGGHGVSAFRGTT